MATLWQHYGHLDTIARVYKDNGNKEKAITIYQKRILPVIMKKGDKKKIDKYNNYFDEISK